MRSQTVRCRCHCGEKSAVCWASALHCFSLWRHRVWKTLRTSWWLSDFDPATGTCLPPSLALPGHIRLAKRNTVRHRKAGSRHKTGTCRILQLQKCRKTALQPSTRPESRQRSSPPQQNLATKVLKCRYPTSLLRKLPHAPPPPTPSLQKQASSVKQNDFTGGCKPGQTWACPASRQRRSPPLPQPDGRSGLPRGRSAAEGRSQNGWQGRRRAHRPARGGREGGGCRRRAAPEAAAGRLSPGWEGERGGGEGGGGGERGVTARPAAPQGRGGGGEEKTEPGGGRRGKGARRGREALRPAGARCERPELGT